MKNYRLSSHKVWLKCKYISEFEPFFQCIKKVMVIKEQCKDDNCEAFMIICGEGSFVCKFHFHYVFVILVKHPIRLFTEAEKPG
jgi:hypothetical protein